MTDEIVEISASKLKLLEGVASLANDLWNDEKVGMSVKERWKEKHPEANIPEVVVAQHTRRAEADIITRVEAKEKDIDNRISAFEKAQKDRDDNDKNIKEQREFAADVETTKKKYGLSAEGMEKVFARMKERNNPDVEAAAAWVTDHQAPAKPIDQPGYGGQSMDLQGSFHSAQEDKDWELLNTNPWDMKFADKEIRQISADFANGKGHLYGPNGMGGDF